MRLLPVCGFLAFALALEFVPPCLMAQTDAFLNAPLLPRGRSLGVQLNRENKVLEWQIRAGETPTAIGNDALLLTRGEFRIGYLHYNPLRVHLDISVADFEDPSQAVYGTLLGAVSKFLSFFSSNPTSTLEKATGDKKDEQRTKLTYAMDAVQSHFKIARKHVLALPDTIDASWRKPAATGPMVLNEAITCLQKDSVLLDEDLKSLKDALADYKSATGGNDPEGLLKQADALIDGTTKFAEAMQAETTQLTADAELSHWDEPDHSIFLTNVTIDPTLTTGKSVTVTITPLTIVLAENELSLKKGEPINASFKVRRYRALLPEAGVGAVIGYIDRPKYGTSTDSSGKTVVALSSTDHVSADPAVMVNFVCRCNTGGLAPMLQVGVATSKDLPEILLGGGIRLFGLGKGDFALGGGLLLGWYKDLQKLKVGSVISGTADIDADLGYINTPKPAPYINFQYKF